MQNKVKVGSADGGYIYDGPFLRLLNELYEAWEDRDRSTLLYEQEKAEKKLAVNFDKLRKQLGRL